MRLYIEDGSCPVCLKLFHSRPRVLHHLNMRSKRCAEYLISHFTPLENAVAAELDTTDTQEQQLLRKQGHHKRKALKPVIQMYGPKLNGA